MPRRDASGRFLPSPNGPKRKRKKAAAPQTAVTLAQALGHAAPPRVRPINIVAFLRDVSGSMDHLKTALRNNFNEVWNATAQASRQLDQDTRAVVYDFSNRLNKTIPMQDIQAPQSGALHWIGMGTQLFNSLEKIMREIEGSLPPEASVLINVLTDGEDDSLYPSEQFKRYLKGLQDTGRWTFSFQMPPGKADAFSRVMGIPRDNIREWEATERGMIETRIATCTAMNNFAAARSSGAKSVANYYAPVTTDLSQVNASQLKQSLQDVSFRFRSVTAEKECPIKSLVEVKTGAPYVIGQAYYQLMKKEEVQPQKAVLIQEKGKKQVWGGDEARLLIGLPAAHEGKLAKVTPGNHSNYDIFVQSTSVNRKVPRGTRLLIDLGHQQNLKPTWDHNAVAQRAP